MLMFNYRSYFWFLVLVIGFTTTSSARQIEIAKKLERNTIGLLSIVNPASTISKIKNSGLLKNEKVELAFQIAKRSFPELVTADFELSDFITNLEFFQEIHVIIHRAETDELMVSMAVKVRDVPKSKPTPEFLVTAIVELTDLAMPDGKDLDIKFHVQFCNDQWLLISNSKKDCERLAANLDDPLAIEKSLFESRRFKTVLNRLHIQRNEIDVFLYGNPSQWKSYAIGQRYARESEWKAKAFDEVASIGMAVNLMPSVDDETFKLFSATSFSFTEPRRGVGAVSDSYLPIESFPPLVESPIHVTAVRKNNRKLKEQNREIFDAIHGQGTFDRLCESFLFDWKSGNRDGLGGTEVNCWYGDRENYPKHLGFLSLNLASGSEKQLIEKVNQYFEFHSKHLTNMKIQQQEIAGYVCWFFSDDIAKQLFFSQRPFLKAKDMEPSFQYPNCGALLWNDWLVFCEKDFASTIDQLPLGTTEPQGEFGEMVTKLTGRFPHIPVPFYVESRWQQYWRVQLKQWQARMIHFLFPNSPEILQKFAYELDEETMTIETDDPKQSVVNLVFLVACALVDEMGQSTLTLSKTEEGDVIMLFGLFSPNER